MLKKLLTAWVFLSLWAPCAVASSRLAVRDSILHTITGASLPAKAVEITRFGARGDSATDCRRAFERAMRYARKQGGARLVVPAGVWLVRGPIHMASGVCLELSKGATIKFVAQPSYFLPMVSTSWEGTFLWNYSPFIYGYGLHDVAIIGEGTIDGDAGDTFATWADRQAGDQQQSRQWNHQGTPVDQRRMGEGHFLRPQLVQFYRCERVTLSGFSIRRSPFWCIHLLQCGNVCLQDLHCRARLTNNDGIDLESSHGVLIDGVHFDNGDDNIAIKSGRDNDGWDLSGPSRDIVIRHCRFKGLHGVVIGSEMSGGVENVFIEDCGYDGYCKRGIFVKTNPDRGGYVRNLYVNNVRFGEVRDLFYVTSMYAGQGIGNSHYSVIDNLVVDSLCARNVTGTALVLQGTPQRPISRVSFNAVDVPHVSKGLSFEFTEPVRLTNCFLGPKVSVPSQASAKDKLFEHNDK